MAGLLELYTDDAILESPLVPRILERTGGVLRGKSELAQFFSEGGRRRPNELVDLTFRLLERAVGIGYGKTSVSDRAETVRELELEQAAEYLRLAISRGFNDLRGLRSHPDSTFLLTREDVKPFIMDMAFPDRPFGDR